jgi:Cu(I)/Ag(I) efflux system membrane fusion protein
MQAVVKIPVNKTTSAFTIPANAIIHDSKGAHIWVKTGEGKFAPRMVETGTGNFNEVEITNGVKEGDVVVVSGAYLLYSEYVLKKGMNPMAQHNH